MEEEIKDEIVKDKTGKYKSLIPLLYLVVMAAIVAWFQYTNVPKEITALIIGAGLTRVKISS